MAFMKLPPELQLRINNYYQARYGGKWFHEKDVMDTVSSALKEVQLYGVRLFIECLICICTPRLFVPHRLWCSKHQKTFCLGTIFSLYHCAGEGMQPLLINVSIKH